MSEFGSPEINIVGVPEGKHEQIRGIYHAVAKEQRQQRLAELQPARLTSEQMAQAREVEQASRRYFEAKMRRLGLPEASLIDFPEVYYTIPRRKEKRAGSFDPVTRVTEVFPFANGEFMMV